MKFISKILIFEQIPIQRRGSIPWSPTSQILVPIRPTNFWDQQFLDIGSENRYWEPLLLRPEFACNRSQLARKKNLGCFKDYIGHFQPIQTFKTSEKVWKSSSEIEISSMEVSGAQTGLQRGPPGWGKSLPGRGDHPEHFICDN